MLAFLRRIHANLASVGFGRTAASLAFTTLLGLVPLATVAFAFVAQFPIFQDWLKALEGVVMQYLVPGAGQTLVRNYIVGFAEQATRLTGVSIVLIFVTATLVVATVEREINLIFGVKRRRGLVRRFIVYAFGLTIGPVLVGASISATTWLLSQSIGEVPLRESLATLIARPLPFALGALALTLLYKIAPARHVQTGHALIGGVLAAAAFEILKGGFAWYIKNVPTYKLVYGALAALPLFMVWIYLCWAIVLAGAAITAALHAGELRR